MQYQELIKYINIKDAAKILGVSPLTLRNWDRKKKLIAYRHPINNYRVYRLDEIQNFMSQIPSFKSVEPAYADAPALHEISLEVPAPINKPDEPPPIENELPRSKSIRIVEEE
ncbi:MerR family DNA-binding transcriptional regulator [Candidatus Giovannonibacteria bacterium]|nr:MerR family DNA-binding transcriptional regulator [Candidatus Giovannonibacteria bacterium]